MGRRGRPLGHVFVRQRREEVILLSNKIRISFHFTFRFLFVSSWWWTFFFWNKTNWLARIWGFPTVWFCWPFSNSLSRSIHFRIIYYISLHSLLKEKETNRPLARFDSNKTLDYSHAKDGDFCEIEKGARFSSLSPSFKREGQFFSRASTRV